MNDTPDNLPTYFNSEAELEEVVALNRAVYELSQKTRITNAPPELIAQLRSQIDSITAQLGAHSFPPPYSQVRPDFRTAGAFPTKNTFQHTMPYSPITGTLNPVSPLVDIWEEDGGVCGIGNLPATFAGPPDTVHGGLVAAIFDELLSMANIVTGHGGWTGTLSIRYILPTPLNQEIKMQAKGYKREGRKSFVKGTFSHKGTVTASAEGIFITPKHFTE